MMHKLLKSSRATYVPGSAGIPSDPGHPFIPAHFANESKRVCSYGINSDAMLAAGWTYKFSPGSGYLPGTFNWVPPPGINGAQIIYGETCKIEVVSYNVPAQPYLAPSPGRDPVPAQIIIDNYLGWNCRAHSVKFFAEYGEVSFTVPPSAIGAVVGLNNSPQKSGYADILFAFYLSHGIIRIMESGTIFDGFGTYNEGDVFTIKRLPGIISYQINGTEINSTDSIDGVLFLDAALYSGGDFVDSPEVKALSGSEILLPYFASHGGEGSAQSGAHSTLKAFVVNSRIAIRSSGSISAFAGIGSERAYAYCSSSLPAFTSSGDGGLLVPTYSVGSGAAIFFTGSAHGFTGEIGGSSGALPSFKGLGSEGSYGDSRGSLAAFTGFSSANEGNGNATIFSVSVIASLFNAPVELYVTFNSRGTISSIFAIGVTIPANMVSSATASSTYALQAVLNALMYSNANGNSVVPLEEQAQEVWVVNTDSMASSRYENYPFNSFAKIDGKHYGAKADGIYLLEGDDDAGAPVQAMISFGKRNFGTSLLKRVTNCYLGIASSGTVFLKVLFEGEEYVYAARDANENMQIQRVDIGRGIRANYLEFELYNADGNDFELASVEFSVVSLSRRI